MKHAVRNLAVAVASVAFTCTSALAGVPKDLAYPSGGNLSADQIMDQVYFVNHFYGYENYGITKKGRNITVLVAKAEGSKPTTNTLERYLDNSSNDGVVKAQDLAIFRSGKLKGTGMLITDYVDDAKSQSYMIWLPALRKIRRFGQPAHDDSWGGTDFTFGDVALRKPHHETHELVGTESFNDCLGFIEIPADQQSRYTKNLPKEGACDHKGKEVYKVKSTTRFENWWYDNRVSYIDTKTFADYRTEYFKGGNQVKVIDRNWVSKGEGDPRNQVWGYWYGKTLATGHQTWAVIPDKVNKINAKYKKGWWSEKTLRKIKR